MLKRELAAQLDALRHEVSQLRADKVRIQADNARLMRENDVLHSDVNRAHKPRCRAEAMQVARSEAMRTGHSVKVNW
jgi:regulator of replication initiation timing